MHWSWGSGCCMCMACRGTLESEKLPCRVRVAASQRSDRRPNFLLGSGPWFKNFLVCHASKRRANAKDKRLAYLPASIMRTIADACAPIRSGRKPCAPAASLAHSIR